MRGRAEDEEDSLISTPTQTQRSGLQLYMTVSKEGKLSDSNENMFYIIPQMHTSLFNMSQIVSKDYRGQCLLFFCISEGGPCNKGRQLVSNLQCLRPCGHVAPTEVILTLMSALYSLWFSVLVQSVRSTSQCLLGRQRMFGLVLGRATGSFCTRTGTY